jgi:hypothetical protein
MCELLFDVQRTKAYVLETFFGSEYIFALWLALVASKVLSYSSLQSCDHLVKLRAGWLHSLSSDLCQFRRTLEALN